MDKSKRLFGSDWQSWAENLIITRYGSGQYQKIPDTHKGDAGIEGFTINDGNAYQMYGPVEPLTTQERFEKLRDKLTTDIRKFIQNENILTKLFGEVKIKRWILLVPSFDSKEIVIHATKKTNEVIDANLPYVDPDFRIVIEDEDGFSLEREQLLKAQIDIITIISEEVKQQQINEWADENDSLVEILTTKISKLSTLKSDESKRIFRDKIIKHFLDGQNTLEEIRRYPEAYEKIREVKSQKERYLSTEAMIKSEPNNKYLILCLNQIRDLVKNEVSGVSETTIDSVAWEAVSDWLIRCPLDFNAHI